MLELRIMEKLLGSIDFSNQSVSPFSGSDLAPLEYVDRLAFDDFWHMDALGLEEAIGATPRTRIFQATVDASVAGYAIVGTQQGVSFLQRIAVDPTFQGAGVGRELITASMQWARMAGAATMLLNVRSENEVARHLYSKQGFADTGAMLRVLRYES